MSFLSRLFGRKQKDAPVARKRTGNTDVYDTEGQDRDMVWAIERAKLTLPYFEQQLRAPKPEQEIFSVKVRFEDRGKTEHIWLTDPSFDGDDNLFGEVGNDPIDITTVRIGQRIGIDRKMVSDWMIVENGLLVGGYTIRAIRNKLPEAQLPGFDAGLGGIQVDVGQDYFPASDAFPEGAILLLEQAYNDDDLKRAVAYKDFHREAAQMLGQLENIEADEELTGKTAEVLKQSFLQHMQENGIPKIQDVIHAFPEREYVADDHIIVTEVCRYPDGSHTVDRLHTFLVNGVWKVGGVVTE